MLAGFPAPRHTVLVRRHTQTGEDYGTPVYGWGQPEPVQVYGWAAPTSTEPKLAGHDRLVVDVEVFAPEASVHHLDRVVLPDGEYTVEGRPEDYTHSPFPGGEGGYVWNLRRVEG